MQEKIRILFFIGSLCSGGKERRLVELLSFLKRKKEYELLLVMTRDEIHYPEFFKLNIPKIVIKKWRKRNDISVFIKLREICNKYKPHIIHTWGSIQTFYAIPSILGKRTVLVNSQITDARPKRKRFSFLNLVDKINFVSSKYILSNSKAGINVFNPPISKTKVIYNGINLNRVAHLPEENLIREKFGILTPYLVLMVASYTSNKNYELFFNVAEQVTKERSDVIFMGVGGTLGNYKILDDLRSRSKDNNQIIFLDRINDVEALMNVSTIGVLLSNTKVHGEGISNAIMEFMALSKPVIANDAGGTNEIVFDKVNGYLVKNEEASEIGKLIMSLLDDQKKRAEFGNAGRNLIEAQFTIDKMGVEFDRVYKEVQLQ